MTTIEDRTAVLRALAAGEISVAEAEERLAAVGDEPAEVATESPQRAERGRGAGSRGRLTVDEVIALASRGVDAAFVAALRKAGYQDLTSDEIIRLADHGVEPDWLRDLQRTGLQASVDELVQLADFGVEADWVREVRKAGVDADVAGLLALAAHGVEADWLAALTTSVLGELRVDEIVALADHGIEPEDLQAFLDLRRAEGA